MPLNKFKSILYERRLDCLNILQHHSLYHYYSCIVANNQLVLAQKLVMYFSDCLVSSDKMGSADQVFC